MLTAQIMGKQNFSKSVNEKPAIYESVIKTHRTSIGHNQNNQKYRNYPSFASNSNFNNNFNNENISFNYGENEENSMRKFENFNSKNFQSQNELKKLGQGRLAIPVKLAMDRKYSNEPVMSKYKYENPSFLSTKSEKKKGKPRTINVPKMPMITPNLIAASKKDVKLIKKKLNKAKSKKQKLKACKFVI